MRKITNLIYIFFFIFIINKIFGKNEIFLEKKKQNLKKSFNSWSLGFYCGQPVIYSADLRSFTREFKGWGYDFMIPITRQLSHNFGVQLLNQYGRSKQFANGRTLGLNSNQFFKGETDYFASSFIFDLNFSNLFRRLDKKNNYTWAIHGYAGPGLLYYDTKLEMLIKNIDVINKNLSRVALKSNYIDSVKMSSGLESMFFQAGIGLKYKINKIFDSEFKLIWYHTGDEKFDGSGSGRRYDDRLILADLKPSRLDSFFTASLGVSFSIGDLSSESLYWYDPVKLIRENNNNSNLKFCKKGDKDDDGVCDDWDKELNTPSGSRVDGSGKSFDVDFDGVIDIYDNCVTIPGPASNNGCPIGIDINSLYKIFNGKIEKEKSNIIENNKLFNNKKKKINIKNNISINFDFNKNYINKSEKRVLNKVIFLMSKKYKTNIKIIGHTDSLGTYLFNNKLSKIRAKVVKNFLLDHGVSKKRINIYFKGENQLKYPECSDFNYKKLECNFIDKKLGVSKNSENRRVNLIFFKKNN